VLQKSKVAGLKIFRETLSSERSLIRATKVACEFARDREVPHILYTKVAPTARRILVIGENRLLQHNPSGNGHCQGRSPRLKGAMNGSHGVAR
jgi:hypothetical protein